MIETRYRKLILPLNWVVSPWDRVDSSVQKHIHHKVVKPMTRVRRLLWKWRVIQIVRVVHELQIHHCRECSKDWKYIHAHKNLWPPTFLLFLFFTIATDQRGKRTSRMSELEYFIHLDLLVFYSKTIS